MQGYGSVGWANPFFPGNLQIFNATIIQTIQIGNDTARAAAVTDLLFMYTDTVIGANTPAHDRAFSLYTQAGLVELTADGSFLFDGRTKPQTQTNGVVDIHLTSAVTATKGLNVDLVAHNLANGEWLYGIMVDPNCAAAITATSSMAAIYLVNPNDTAQCDTYGLYIEAGYDFGLAVLAPVKLAQLTIAPTADGAAPWPLDFQLEGWPTAGVYTQGRVINMEYGLARTLDGALEAIHIDFTTNLTKNGQTVTGMNLLNSVTDEANLGTAIQASDNLTQTLAAAVNHRGAFVDYTSVLTCTNGGGTVTANTNPIINLTLNMAQTAGAVSKSLGIFNATVNRTAGTPTLSGNMINFETTGAGALSADFTGYRLVQAWAHDDLAADTLRGIQVSWTGAVPGAQASNVNLLDIAYTGTIGAAGGNATLAGFNVGLGTAVYTAGTVYGGRILVDAPNNAANPYYGLEITKNATLAAAGGAPFAVTNEALRVTKALANNNAGGLGITDNSDFVFLDMSHAMNSAAAPATDTVGGRMLYITATGQTGAATDTLDFTTRALDILYTTAIGAGVINLNATDIARVNVKVGAGTVLGGDFNAFSVDMTGFDPNTVPGAPRTISAVNVNYTGSTYANSANCIIRGATIVMPAGYQAAAVESAMFLSGNTNTITALPKSFNLDMTFSEAVPGGTSKAGIRITPDCNVANAVNAVWDGVYVNMTGIVYAGAAHQASGMRINMVANTDHAILMQGAAAFITSAEQTLELRTTQTGAGAGPAVTIRTANGVGTGAGGGINFVTGNGAAAGAAADGGSINWTLGNGATFGGVGASGGSFNITGGNSDGAAPGIAGGFSFIGGTGSGGGSQAGGVSLVTGPPNGGARGLLTLGNADVGAIQIGAAGSVGSTFTADSTAAMLLRSTGSTIELRTTGANNISVNPGNSLAARAFTTLNNTGIINGRWEATQLHEDDDFVGPVLGLQWGVTINGAGSVVMQIGANSQIGGVVRLQDSGAAGNNDAAISYGTNKVIDATRRPIHEVRVKVDVIAGANGTQLRAMLWNAGAFNAVGNWIGFEFDAAVNANWRCKTTRGGGAIVDVDSTVAVVAGTWYTLRQEYDVTTGDVRQYINGALVNTFAAAQAPAAATLLEPMYQVLDGGLGAGLGINYDIDYSKVWQSRT